MEKTKLVAHRGLSSLYYQNTLEAFEKAAESNYFDCIETDIWQTVDGYWVCCHDRDPFEDSKLLIDNITLDEALAAPLSKGKARRAKVEKDMFICTFYDYLNVCSKWNLKAVIEIKSLVPKDQIPNLLHLIDAKLLKDGYVIISFKQENIDNILSLDDCVNAQMLTSNYTQAKAYLNGGYNIGVMRTIATANLIKRTQAKGKEINVWTVNSSKRARSLIEQGIDYLTTDCILELD